MHKYCKIYFGFPLFLRMLNIRCFKTICNENAKLFETVRSTLKFRKNSCFRLPSCTIGTGVFFNVHWVDLSLVNGILILTPEGERLN